jgi:hypothetical protein
MGVGREGIWYSSSSREACFRVFLSGMASSERVQVVSSLLSKIKLPEHSLHGNLIPVSSAIQTCHFRTKLFFFIFKM